MDIENIPAIYIFHGEDELAINEFVDKLIAKMGEPSMAMMNITRLEGQSLNLEELRSAVSAMPFLTDRRLVIVTNPLSGLKSPDVREKFIKLLEQTHPSTALVLIEYRTLKGQNSKKHWLERWARKNQKQAYIKVFPLPRGGAMVNWIQSRAESLGGKFTPRAAGVLASLVGGDKQLADQEIRKLLAYVNYLQPVQVDDVENLTAIIPEADIFVMVDALGNRDGKRAMWMLHRLLEAQDPIPVFGMVVRQFRLLLLAREVLDRGGNERDVARALKIHPYVAGKITQQAHHFTMPTLERAYHRLLGMDEAMKSSQVPGDLALDTLVAEFTGLKGP